MQERRRAPINFWRKFLLKQKIMEWCRLKVLEDKFQKFVNRVQKIRLQTSQCALEQLQLPLNLWGIWYMYRMMLSWKKMLEHDKFPLIDQMTRSMKIRITHQTKVRVLNQSILSWGFERVISPSLKMASWLYMCVSLIVCSWIVSSVSLSCTLSFALALVISFQMSQVATADWRADWLADWLTACASPFRCCEHVSWLTALPKTCALPTRTGPSTLWLLRVVTWRYSPHWTYPHFQAYVGVEDEKVALCSLFEPTPTSKLTWA